MRLLRAVAALALSAALAWPACAAPRKPAHKAEDPMADCLDRAFNAEEGQNPKLAACGEDDVQRQEKRLKAVIAKLRPLFEPKSREAFDAEQKAWVAYRKVACGYYATGDFGRQGQVLDYYGCLAGVIKHRAADLQDTLKELQQE